MRRRVLKTTRARLNEAAARWSFASRRVTAADLVRKAHCAYLNRDSVKLPQISQPFTDANSVVIGVEGVPWLEGISLDELIVWFLDLRGEPADRPRLDIAQADVDEMNKRGHVRPFEAVAME